MNLLCQFVGRGAMLVAGLAVVSGAQVSSGSGDSGDPHRWGIAIAGDAGSLPDEFATFCTGNGDAHAALGAGAAIVYRPRGPLLFEGGLRITGPLELACSDVLHFRLMQNGELRGPATALSGTPHAPPLARSVLRIGLEAPRPFPLIRAMIGGGVVVGNGTAPFGTASIGVGTRSAGIRPFADLETSVSRARVTAVYTRYVGTGVSSTTERRTAIEVVHPRWTTLRVGLEFPLTGAH